MEWHVSFLKFHFYCHVLLNICLQFSFGFYFGQYCKRTEIQTVSKLSHSNVLNDVKSIEFSFFYIPIVYCVRACVCVGSFWRHTWSLIFWIKQLFRIGLDQFNGRCSSFQMTWSIFCYCACAYKWNRAFRTRSLDSFKSSDRKYVNDFYGKNGIWSFVEQFKPQNFYFKLTLRLANSYHLFELACWLGFSLLNNFSSSFPLDEREKN